MAFWVTNRGRTPWATGRGPYFVGGKRRVSLSEGGDIGDSFEYKRSRFGLDEFRSDEYAQNRDQGDYSYCNNNRYAVPHNGLSRDYHPAMGGNPRSPIDDDDRYHYDYEHDIDTTPPPQNSFTNHQFAPAKNPPFFIIQERSATPEFPSMASPGSAPGMGPVIAPPGLGPPGPGTSAMERTESGLSVSSDTTQNSLASLGPENEEPNDYVDDIQAAHFVLDYVVSRRRYPDSRHGRILKALISPKLPINTPDFIIDNQALGSIFSAANELFFANRLTGRVTWDWSHPGSEQYHMHIVGTTAVRRSRRGGYEMLIVLSSPILKDTKYNRRLLISTFLHEMIHSYLFVACGLKAGLGGGHTEGFRQIAEEIDRWVGRGHLRLGEMEADLEQFRQHNHRHEIEYSNRSASMDGERRMRDGSPWRRWDDCAGRDGHDYYPIEPRPLPPQQRQHYQRQLQQHPAYDGWQWPEQDRFCSHGPRGVGSSYV